MEGSTNSELKVTTESPSRWARVLTIEVPRKRFEDERNRIVQDLRKRVVRPGFRKGRVPRELVERDFADRIQADALERFIPAVCSEAIAQEKLEVISTPNVKSVDLDHPEMVRMHLELEVRPEFQLGDLGAIHVEAWKPEVRDGELEKAMDRLRDQHAQFEAVERQAQDGDFVLVSYVPLDDEGNQQTENQVENYPFELGRGHVVSEFETAVRGLAPGGQTRVEVRYADDHENKEIAGKLVAFLLTLKEVKEKRLPDLDDELARDLGLDSLAELQEQVRKDLGRRLQEEADRDLREKLIDRLIEANVFEVPRSMVERYLEAVLEDYDERHRQMQVDVEQEKREEFATSARPAAERAVRRMLLIDKLKREHSLEASEEDVDKWIEERVQAGGSDAVKLRAFFKDRKRRQRLHGELTENKVFEFLKSQAVVTEVPRPTVS